MRSLNGTPTVNVYATTNPMALFKYQQPMLGE